MSDQKTSDAAPSLVGVSRMVDMRLPLPYLLTALGTGAAILIGMFFQLNSMTEEVRSMKTTLQTNNTQVMSIMSEITILKFQLTMQQEEIKTLKAKM